MTSIFYECRSKNEFHTSLLPCHSYAEQTSVQWTTSVFSIHLLKIIVGGLDTCISHDEKCCHHLFSGFMTICKLSVDFWMLKEFFHETISWVGEVEVNRTFISHKNIVHYNRNLRFKSKLCYHIFNTVATKYFLFPC